MEITCEYPSRVFDDSDDKLKAQKIKDLCSDLNKLQQVVESNRLATRTVCYEKVTEYSLLDFSILTLEHLRDLTLGGYQVSN